MITRPDLTTKHVFEVKNNPQKHCGKPTDIYPNYYGGGFDLRSGPNIGKERIGVAQILQYIAPNENNGFAQLYAYDPNFTSHKTSHGYMYLNLDYQMPMGAILEFLFFQSSPLLQASEIQFLKNKCGQVQTQILTNLMLSLENQRLAGYMVTGNRSMFLETDGSLALLYHCPKVLSPLYTMNQCHVRIPIPYEGQIQFVDPSTRQTHPAAILQNFTDRIEELFQFDFDLGHSMYNLTPGILHQDRTALFGLKDVSLVAVSFFPGPRYAGMYTRSEFSSF